MMHLFIGLLFENILDVVWKIGLDNDDQALILKR